MRITTTTRSLATASVAAILLTAGSVFAASNEQKPNAQQAPQPGAMPCVTSDCSGPAKTGTATTTASAEPRTDYAQASVATPKPKRPKVDPRQIEEFQRLNPGG